MKKVKYLLFSLLLIFVYSDKVLAICEDDELNDWAEDAEVVAMEDNDMDIYDESGNLLKTHKKKYHYLLLVYPQTNLVYAKVRDSITNKEYVVGNDSDFLTIAIGSKIHYEKKKYTITLYGSSDSACPNEKLKTLTYEANPYNKYMINPYCIEYPDDEKCKFDSDAGTMTEEEFNAYVSSRLEAKEVENMSWIAKVWFYIKKYWYYVVIPVVLISIFYGITIFIEKKKKVN